MADFTPVTTSSTEPSDSQNSSLPGEHGNPNSPSKQPVVSYMGSTSSTGQQALNRATTSSSLGSSQENVPALVRSKTVGGLPTMSSVVFAKGAASTVLCKKDDSLPIAVAFIESVNAFFRGSDQSKWELYLFIFFSYCLYVMSNAASWVLISNVVARGQINLTERMLYVNS